MNIVSLAVGLNWNYHIIPNITAGFLTNQYAVILHANDNLEVMDCRQKKSKVKSQKIKLFSVQQICNERNFIRHFTGCSK